mgnify:CR=1 FL=1
MQQQEYPLNVLNIQKLNSVLRHRLRNLYAGFDMALDTIQRDLQAAGSSSAERCDLLKADLKDIYRFTERMTLLLDPLPAPETMDLQTVISETLAHVRKQYPLCRFQCEGTEESYQLKHGNWYRFALIELLFNAAQATGEDGTIKVVWKTKPTVEIAVLNTGVTWPSDVKIEPPEPFENTKGQNDGMGLSIVKRICDAMDAELEILTDHPELVGVRIANKTEEQRNDD